MFKTLWSLTKGLWWSLVVLTPLLGVWLASSLATYLNGPFWLAILAGAALFPGLPLAWELWASRRFKKKQAAREAAGKAAREAWLVTSDRMILRTLTINLAFLGALLASFPLEAFTALSTRGDWMLDGAPSHPVTESTRRALFTTAGGLEWLHNVTRDNPYERDTETPSPTADEVGDVEIARAEPSNVEPPTPTLPEGDPQPSARDAGAAPVINEVAVSPPPRPSTVTPPRPGAQKAQWPLGDTPHPLVQNLPAHQSASIESAARYIAQRETDPFLRVKALHDLVATRIAYDINTLGRGQDAERVFERGTAVCEGYARLLVRLGEITGDEIVYIVGVSRGMGGTVGGGGHAWNAAKIGGKWYLIDATWSAGHVEGNTFKPAYSTDYLFTPPEAFLPSHFPDDPAWQLVSEPIARGDWMRLPMLKPGFLRHGLALVSPTRSQTTVEDVARVAVRVPHGRFVMGRPVSKDGRKLERCEVKTRDDLNTELACKFEKSGTYQVQILASNTLYGVYDYVGEVEFVAR